MQRRTGLAGQREKVDLVQAKVADEAEWDVGHDVRAAWGIEQQTG